MCMRVPCSYHCLPCTDGPDPRAHEAPSSCCSPVVRIALSIASIAIGILSTSVFLTTHNIVALGLTVALSVAAICLWPKRNSYPSLPSRVLYSPPPFGAAFLPPQPVYPIVPPPVPMPLFVAPSTDRHVRVGDRMPVAPPILPFTSSAAPFESAHGGEQRIPIHSRERTWEGQRSASTPMATHSHAQAAGEQRVNVGRGGHVDLRPPSDEDRIPIGRGRR